VIDPVVTAAAVGGVGALTAGPALAYGLDRVPDRHRRVAAWSLVLGALTVTLLFELVFRAAAGHLFVYVLASLPGVLTFIASRSLLATAFVALLPFYLVIGDLTRGMPVHAPALALDRAMPLRPAWMAVYGSLYAFAWFMPLVVVRDWRLGRRALQAYLAAMVPCPATDSRRGVCGSRTIWIPRTAASRRCTSPIHFSRPSSAID
jgi:hypothetical protein